MQRESSITPGGSTTSGSTTEPASREMPRNGAVDSDSHRPSPDLIEFAGAALLGAVIGAGVTLLLRPKRRRGAERIRHDLAPYRKKVKERAQSARRSFAEGADATSEAAEALGEAGRTLIQGLREEIGEIIGSAREDFTQSVNDQVSHALDTIKRGYKKARH